jgi:hypothetical protein
MLIFALLSIGGLSAGACRPTLPDGKGTRQGESTSTPADEPALPDDPGIARLKEIGSVSPRRIDLHHTTVRDDDLACLRILSDVEEISLRGTAVTDDGVRRCVSPCWHKSIGGHGNPADLLTATAGRPPRDCRLPLSRIQ